MVPRASKRDFRSVGASAGLHGASLRARRQSRQRPLQQPPRACQHHQQRACRNRAQYEPFTQDNSGIPLSYRLIGLMDQAFSGRPGNEL